MANVLSRVQEGIDLFRRAEEIFTTVTGTLNDGREAVNETSITRLQEMLKRERIESKDAFDGLNDAVAAYRKRQG